MAKQKGKDVKIDASIGENNIKIDKSEEGTHVVYDGKKRDFEYHQDKDGKQFIYDGEKLDIEVNKDGENTEVKIDAANGFLKWVGKIISKFVLRRKK